MTRRSPAAVGADRIAAADGFLVAVPEERPFGEQDATARHLAELGLGAVVGRDDPVDVLVEVVRESLERARSTPAGSGLRDAWEVDGAAGRIATVLESVADRTRIGHPVGEEYRSRSDARDDGGAAAATDALAHTTTGIPA